MKTFTAILSSIVLTSGLPSAPASAGGPFEELQEHEFEYTPMPGIGSFLFDQFDDQDATRALCRVTLWLDGELAADHVTVENDSTLPAPDFGVNLSGFMTVDLVDLLDVQLQFNETFVTDGTVGPSDGVPGSGPDFWDFGVVSDHGITSATATVDLGPYIGTGSLTADVFATGGLSFIGTTIATIVGDEELSAAGVITLVYEFEFIEDEDLDDDGDVDEFDLAILLEHWGPCPPPPTRCVGDVDGDGMVGFNDLLHVLAAWS
ncbi:MAG: choice-of-anchor E domain-containing protein [Phycisphaerales bacterium]|nr:choice-of-anchor E domain-containing protein [Phycisphaerae bacterium]NNF43893.1 choice-of-anchor E domain-containing protein [Phycisphaerales bacterium]NNM25605.1 choice-of-anchor E domain-containing protein [Phycisphaerales bacterium]